MCYHILHDYDIIYVIVFVMIYSVLNMILYIEYAVRLYIIY